MFPVPVLFALFGPVDLFDHGSHAGRDNRVHGYHDTDIAVVPCIPNAELIKTTNKKNGVFLGVGYGIAACGASSDGAPF